MKYPFKFKMIFEYTYEILSPGGLCKVIYGKAGTSVLVVATGYRNDKGEYDMIFRNQNWGSDKDIDLLYIPKKDRTYNVCVKAVQNSLGLSYVPEVLRTKEICMIALNRNKLDMIFVPDSLQSDPDILKFK